MAFDGEFADISGTIDILRRQIERDPLGAIKTSMADLEPRLAGERAQLDALEQTRASVTADLARAADLLEQLLATNAVARDAQRRTLAEIRDPVGLQAPLNDGQIEGLRPWLATLRRTVDQGKWPAAKVGLERWFATATAYQAAAERARAANCAAPEKRDELAGLLRARGAQVTDLARRGLYLSPDAGEAAWQAKALLAERPCRVEEAEANVVRFDAAVSLLAQSARHQT